MKREIHFQYLKSGGKNLKVDQAACDEKKRKARRKKEILFDLFNN